MKIKQGNFLKSQGGKGKTQTQPPPTKGTKKDESELSMFQIST